MGNHVCCDDTRTQNIGGLRLTQQKISVPTLSVAISDHLDSYKPFENQLPANGVVRRFQNDIYQGLLDNMGRPEGMGKMYKKDGTLFIGNFHKGIANGKGRIIFPNGSFYSGQIKDNQADAIDGEYVEDTFSYKGGFKENKFHGPGKEKGIKHQFTGIYNMSKKVKGQFKWDTVPNNNIYEYIYNGQFDSDGNFTGKGILQEIKGKYVGQFKNGKKNGKGQYTFKNKVKYVGNYKDGLKDGEGTIYNDDGSVCYSGLWKNGLPNGKGYIFDEDGKKNQSDWIDGIDSKII